MNYTFHLPLAVIAAIVFAGCAPHAAPPPDEASSPATGIDSPGRDEPESMTSDWPFEDVKNTAVITLKRIVDGSNPILYVVHDEDGDWQFLDGGDVSEEDAATVSLENIVNRDLSIRQLADLPTGWAAERETVNQQWQRYQR